MQRNKNDFSDFEKFLPPLVHRLAIDILNAGGQCVIVGGWIYPYFGVIRLKNIDLSLPRTEILLGKKYNDFQVKLNPYLTFSKAASRRDFSLNAIGWNFLTQEVFDPFAGINAIKQKCLIPLTDHFKEDSYRVLRAAQLIARFNFNPSELLITFARQMDPKVISQQHIQITQKIFQTAKYKKATIDFLRNIGNFWEKLIF